MEVARDKGWFPGPSAEALDGLFSPPYDIRHRWQQQKTLGTRHCRATGHGRQ